MPVKKDLKLYFESRSLNNNTGNEALDENLDAFNNNSEPLQKLTLKGKLCVKLDSDEPQLFLPKCNYCGLKFLCQESLENHKNMKHENHPKKKSKQKKFDEKTKEVQIIKYSKNYFCCDFDGKKFVFKRNLRSHMKYHLPANKCEFCNVKMKYYQMYRHMKSAHPFERYSTRKSIKVDSEKVCVKKIKTRSLIKKAFQCTKCPKSFNNKSGLNQHKYRSHPKILRQCDLCGNLLKTKQTMKYHIDVHKKLNKFLEIQNMRECSSVT
ncbi:hypothetical protein ACKWTF_015267 [Chironomus riparius]